MPLLNIEPHHIVPDELHLLLRVGDILARNLINHVATSTHKKCAKQVRDSLNKVEAAAAEFGVTFHIWEERGPDEKPSGVYAYTSLRGKDVSSLLQKLPAKFPEFVDQDIQAQMAKIWLVCSTH